MFIASIRSWPTITCLIALTGCLEQEQSSSHADVPTSTTATSVAQQIDYSRFEDTALSTCLQRQGITHSTQAQIVSCPQQQVRSLRGIEQLSETRILSVPHNAIQDLSPLMALSQLHSLDIDNNKVAKLDSIGKLPALRNVSAKNNLLADISGLKGSPLEKLYLDNNPLTSLDTLSDLPQLKHVSARGHKASIPQLAASVQTFQLESAVDD